MAADRPRLRQRPRGRARRPARQELDQRNLYPQHVRRLAVVHDPGARSCAPSRDGGRMSMREAAAGEKSAALDVAACEQFLVHEARLLDEARFDDWLALFTADAWYWVPSEPGQKSPRDTISLIYDDRRLLETRVRRLMSPRIYSQEPRSRTSRIVANVTIEEGAADGRACTVRSKFQLLEYRRNAQTA